jgi:hypothetical protein
VNCQLPESVALGSAALELLPPHAESIIVTASDVAASNKSNGLFMYRPQKRGEGG